jgi:DNA-3-methyladenine glycosylase II
MAQKAPQDSLIPPDVVRFLSDRDKKLAAVIEAVGVLQVPPKPDGFEALARAIVGQQLSAKAAQTIFRRIALACGVGQLTAERFLRVSKLDLRLAGLSARKESFLHSLASSVTDGALDLTALEDYSDPFVIARLCALKGIGRWTAEMHLIFGMNRPDVFPTDDVALQRVMCRVYGWKACDFVTKGPRIASRWRPFRSIACRYLYAFGDMRR